MMQATQCIIIILNRYCNFTFLQKTETTDSTGEIDLSDSESEPEKQEEKSPEPVEQSPQEEKSMKEDEQQPSTSKSWRDESDEDEDKNEGNKVEEKTISIFTEEDLLEECYAAFKAGNYGPKLIKTADVEQVGIFVQIVLFCCCFYEVIIV